LQPGKRQKTRQKKRPRTEKTLLRCKEAVIDLVKGSINDDNRAVKQARDGKPKRRKHGNGFFNDSIQRFPPPE
jgi:hypothetical protein